MGTNCLLRWRKDGEREYLWVVDSGHLIVNELGAEFFKLPLTETSGEQFGIPARHERIMIS